jgi:hypothetical protein
VLVAAKEHREQVVDDLSLDEYLALQGSYTAWDGRCATVPTERLYVLSLGEGNSHVHWHLAPLPPGVTFAQQQLAALDTDLGLDLGDDALDELVARIRAALAETGDRRA